MAIINQRLTKYGPMFAPGYPSHVDELDRNIQRPYVQKTLALPYTRYVRHLSHVDRLGNAGYMSATTQVQGALTGFIQQNMYSTIEQSPNRTKVAYNKAYAKLVKSAKQGNADMLALVLERKQAYEMISGRSQQILRIAEAAESKSWKKLAKVLRTSVPDLKRRHAKTSGFMTSPSTTFLEVYWGWMPLLGDAVNAVAYLGLDLVPLKVAGSSGFPIQESSLVGRFGSGTYSDYEAAGIFRLKVGGVLTVESALQSELSRLGVTNGAASFYEVLPYSWLLDWFTSVGQVIETFDDSLQFRLTNTYVTRFLKFSETHHYESRWGNDMSGWNYARTHAFTRRDVRALPTAFLTIFPPKVTLLRAASVMALLTLKLKRFKRFYSNSLL